MREFIKYFNKTKLINVLYALLAVALFVSCEDCKHDNTYSKVSDYQILYPYGIGSDFENIYDYKIQENCVKIKKGKVCAWCGNVIGFKYETICGTYQVREFKYYR